MGGVEEVLVFAHPLGVYLLIHLMHDAQHGVFEAEVVGVLDVDAASAVGYAGRQLDEGTSLKGHILGVMQGHMVYLF